MGKIGILSLYYKNYNFGGALQAYALNQKINEIGLECEQISYDRMMPDMLGKKKFRIRSFKDFLRMIKYNAKQQLLEHNFDKKTGAAIPYFDDFLEAIPHSERYTERNIELVNDIYSCVVVGSDQVWNTSYADDSFFLPFFKGKKVAYAASSGGCEKICDEKYANYLNDFYRISVREKTDKIKIQDKLGKDIDYVIDPTLLLNAEDWRKMERAPKTEIPEKYVFLYKLGLENNSDIERMKSSISLPIVSSPRRYRDICLADSNLHEVGPREFLYLIDHAEYIVTDSFHATVFSSLFHKKCITLRRNSMNERIDSFFDTFGVNFYYNLSNDINNIEWNYTKFESALDEKRREAVLFLKDSLTN